MSIRQESSVTHAGPFTVDIHVHLGHCKNSSLIFILSAIPQKHHAFNVFRASMIWIIGEYAERIDNAAELLESFLEGFQDENTQVHVSCHTQIKT